MYDVLLNEIIYFNALEKSEKASFICSKLKDVGCEFQLQSFESSFGIGTNIVVFKTLEKTLPVTVLTAHYDGNSFYDNNCGVLTLLEITKKLYENKPDKNFIILFSDQEEVYQQGSYFFLKNNSKLEIESNINIDGFGIGEGIYTNDVLPFEKSSMFFFTDSAYFKSAAIKSTSLFSAFESEIEKSKDEDVHIVFKDYVNPEFFIQKFDSIKYNSLVRKLWEYIYIV